MKTAHIRGVDHENPIVRFNARFGLWITLIVGTMWCGLPVHAVLRCSQPSRRDQTGHLLHRRGWLSSSFLQLVLLPIIIVGQNIQAKAADKRAEDTYKDAEAVLKEAEEIQKHLLAQDKAITSIVERLEQERHTRS